MSKFALFAAKPRPHRSSNRLAACDVVGGGVEKARANLRLACKLFVVPKMQLVWGKDSLQTLLIPGEICEAVPSDRSGRGNDVAWDVDLAQFGHCGDESESQSCVIADRYECCRRMPLEPPVQRAVGDFPLARLHGLFEVVSAEQLQFVFVGVVLAWKYGSESHLNDVGGYNGAEFFAGTETDRTVVALFVWF